MTVRATFATSVNNARATYNGAVPAVVSAAVEPDPIFARQRQWLTCTSVELIRIYPTTIDGVAALLKYYAESAAIDDGACWPQRFWNDVDEADDPDLDLDNKPFDLFLMRHAANALERITQLG